jgi:coenzyme F420-dependent glucose-6-phosphate dehydrogenase
MRIGDRFWLAIGSGEALNESITGDAWPPKPIRNARLEEAARTMRALWAGETVSHEGYSRVKEAHVYSRPARPPMLVGAAISAETARWVASWADALITVAGPDDRMRAVSWQMSRCRTSKLLNSLIVYPMSSRACCRFP